MQDPVLQAVLPVLLFAVGAIGLAVLLLVMGNLFNPRRPSRVKRMPYESGMDPIHDTRRRFDVRFHLLAIAFLLFDVELLFLYPWAVAFRPPAAVEAPQTAQVAAPTAAAEVTAEPAVEPSVAPWGERPPFVFAGGLVFIVLLTLGFIYDWRKGIFHWR